MSSGTMQNRVVSSIVFIEITVSSSPLPSDYGQFIFTFMVVIPPVLFAVHEIDGEEVKVSRASSRAAGD